MNTVNISFSSLDEGGDVIESKSPELPGDKKTSSFSVADNEEAFIIQRLLPDNEEESTSKEVSSIFLPLLFHTFSIFCIVLFLEMFSNFLSTYKPMQS